MNFASYFLPVLQGHEGKKMFVPFYHIMIMGIDFSIYEQLCLFSQNFLFFTYLSGLRSVVLGQKWYGFFRNCGHWMILEKIFQGMVVGMPTPT